MAELQIKKKCNCGHGLFEVTLVRGLVRHRGAFFGTISVAIRALNSCAYTKDGTHVRIMPLRGVSAPRAHRALLLNDVYP